MVKFDVTDIGMNLTLGPGIFPLLLSFIIIYKGFAKLRHQSKKTKIYFFHFRYCNLSKEDPFRFFLIIQM